MSSATSTDVASTPPHSESSRHEGEGLQPWQFFVLAALVCATIVTYLVRGQGATVVILVSVLMVTTALVGLAVLRTVQPLVTAQEDRTPMVGERTRAALEREKMLALRTLKELEFDRAMKKISEDDYREMSTRLRARATRMIQQLDAGGGNRAKIEADLAKRLGDAARKADLSGPPVRRADLSGPPKGDTRAPKAATRTCAACSTVNDMDAKFCKGCGSKL
jgi:hypothetical protein